MRSDRKHRISEDRGKMFLQMGLGTGLFRMPSMSLVALTVPLMLGLSVVGVALPAWRASQIRVTEALWRG